jgi:hypothetical protein
MLTIVESIARATHSRNELSRVLAGEFKGDTKTLVLLAYLDLALEHHQAVCELVTRKLHGSAFALVRVIFEILYCAHWVNAVASPSDIEKIASKRNFQFPGMETVVRDIDLAYGVGSFFEDLKKRSWKAMNSYTHSGLLQLAKRFKGSAVQPSYSEAAVLEVLEGTSMSILMLGSLISKATGRTSESELIERLIETLASSDS